MRARAWPRRSSRRRPRERIPGPIWAVADTASPYSASWNTTGFGDGAYDLRVITTDNLGNSFTSAADGRRARRQHRAGRGARSRARCDRGVPECRQDLLQGQCGRAASARRDGGRRRLRRRRRRPSRCSARPAGRIPCQTVTTPESGPYASSAFAWTSGASTPGTYTVSAARRRRQHRDLGARVHGGLRGADGRRDRAGRGSERSAGR